MTRIHVCAITRLSEVAQASGAQDLVSLVREHLPVERPPGIEADRHLRLAFNDITEPREGLRLVQQTDVKALLAFIAR